MDTAGLTVLGAVVVFCTERVIERWLLDSLYEYKKTKGEVHYALTFYASSFCNPGVGDHGKLDEASAELRRLASKLQATADAIAWRRVLESLKLIEHWSAIRDAVGNLIGISNCMVQGDGRINDDKASDVRKLLRFRP